MSVLFFCVLAVSVADSTVYNFIVPDNIMEAAYYKSSAKGYVLTHRTPPNVNHSRQLPVYRVVNEFMNLEDRLEEPPAPEQAENQKIYVDILNFASRSGTEPANQVRYMSRDPSRVMEREEVKSVYTI